MIDEKQEYFAKWYAKHREEAGRDYVIASLPDPTEYPHDYGEAVMVKGYSHDQYKVRWDDWETHPYIIRRNGKRLTAEEVIALLNQAD